MTDELTEERVRAVAAVVGLVNSAGLDPIANTVAALARAWLANAAAPPASPWRRITPDSYANMGFPGAPVLLGRRGEIPFVGTRWVGGWAVSGGQHIAEAPYEPTRWKPLDEPPTEAGR